MANRQKRTSNVRRWLKGVLYCVYLSVAIGVLLEVALRFVIPFNPSYYTGFGDPKPNSVVRYPYGDIKFNSEGFPDEDFASSKIKPRIAYLGDSVCYGVGAGYGYRVTELLEERLPDFEHMNFGRVAATGIQPDNADWILETVVDPYDLDLVVYLFNLNDILPDPLDSASGEVIRAFSWRDQLDWLRGRSYLYTYVRNIIKSYFIKKGYGISGLVSYEFYPSKYAEIIQATAGRINRFFKQLDQRGVKFLLVILPYEMQISSEAAEEYAGMGIEWEGDTFIDRGTQRALIDALDEDMPVVDGYFAFVNRTRTREDNGLGQFFVFNRGDLIDWNHPNREGHRLLADLLYQEDAIAP